MLTTWSDVKNIVAQYAGKSGKCPSSKETELFAKKVLQSLLLKCPHGHLKKWCFCAHNGCFTAPEDLETPLKVKIDGKVERAWDKFYEFYDHRDSDFKESECGLFEEINRSPVAFDIPSSGARILAAPHGPEQNCKILIKGLDLEGRERVPPGEELKLDYETPTYTANTFAKITAILKEKTIHPVTLFWFNPQSKTRGILAEIRPLETIPSYRRYQLKTPCYGWHRVSVLGRIKTRDSYHDTDIVPVSNLYQIELMAQSMQDTRNSNIEAAAYRERVLRDSIRDENQYNKTTSQPLDFVRVLSCGSIENL